MPLPSREEALSLLESHIKTKYTLDHSLATEAIMRALARRFDADEDLWGLSGLLHDLDLELVAADPLLHARKTVEILEQGFDFPKEGLKAILAHNGDELGIPCETPFEYALTAAESVTGLIFATALIYPSKKIEDVKPKSIEKRMKEKRFAAKISRERIRYYEKLELEASDFFSLAIEAMIEVSE